MQMRRMHKAFNMSVALPVLCQFRTGMTADALYLVQVLLGIGILL